MRLWLVLACSWCLVSYSTLAHTSESEYGLKESLPSAGSSIRKYVLKSPGLPINKKYQELTDDERLLLSHKYDHVNAGDEPPFPANGLKPIYLEILKTQEKLRLSGTLALVVAVDSSGHPTAVKRAPMDDSELTDAVETTLMQTTFKPAVCSGSPCAMDFPFQVELVR